MIAFVIVLIVVLAYAWVVYPAVMLWIARGRHARGMAGGDDVTATWPGVAILISAHNEEGVIGQRLENLAALDYPAERVTVFVGVDGGSDRTAEIARAWAAGRAGIHVVVSPVNRGKTAMLRELVAAVRARASAVPSTAVPSTINHQPSSSPAALLVFTDANTLFERGALKRLVEPFSDPRVGGACGRLVFHSPGGGQTDEPHYWDVETKLKAAESRLDSCLGANGAIYAIRCDLFPDIPDNVIVDDFVIGMKVREQGFRMVFVEEASAREDLPPTVADEWSRRVRIGGGAYQALCLCRACLAPRFGVFAWMFWSHKVLRWFTPHLLVALAGAGGILAARWAMVDALRGWGIGAAAGGAAVVMLLARRSKAKWAQTVSLLMYFVVIQAALFVGFLRFCRGDLAGAWKRTERRS